MVIVIALFTALIAPYFIDWTNHKQDFEKQASRIIGQKVTVGGDANVRILPLPSISFTELSVGENPDGSAMMTVDSFKANVELMPFLSGEVRIVDMALVKPIFNLEIDQNGKIAWTERQQALVDPGQVKLDRLTIENAEFNLKGLSTDRLIKGRAINADVSALSLYGPWRIIGRGEIDDEASQFDFSTGRFAEEDQSIRLKTNIRRLDKPYALTADGTVSLRDDVLSWGGEFAVDPVAVSSLGPAGNNKQPLPVNVKGAFNLTPTQLTLPEYSINIGSKEDPFSLSGQGFAQLKGGIDFRLQIDGRQVDLERIVKMREGEEATANTLETRIALFRDVLEQIPVPSFAGEIDLEIPAIIAGDTFIREVSVVIRPFGEGWEIVRLSSSLPGNTLVEASGRLGSGKQFGFHGNLLIASRQPSGFASWASGKVDPAIRRLSSVGLNANVTLTPSQISFDQLELLLDQNRLTGRVQRLAPVEPIDASGKASPSAIVADLAGDNVKLEDLRAVASLLTGEESLGIDNDFDVTLKADELSGFDVSAKNVDLQFQYKNSQLSIARLNLDDFLGTSIKSQGQITNLLEQPRGNMSLALTAGNLRQIAAYAGEQYGWNAPLLALADAGELSQNTELHLEFDSRPVELDGKTEPRNRILLNGNLGGTQITARSGINGSLDNLAKSWIDASLEANNENGSELIRQLGMERFGFSMFQDVMDAPLKLSLETVGSGEKGYSTHISANNKDASISAKGSVNRSSKDGAAYDFDVTLGASNIAPLVYSFGYSIPGLNAALGDVAPFSSKFQIKASPEQSMLIVISKGQIIGNGFSGSIEMAKTASDDRRWDAQIDVQNLSLNTMAGLVVGQSFTDETGNWSETEFAPSILADENGKLKLTAQKIDFGLASPGEEANVEISLNNGDL
ncbi:MAG: AsmA family protein, partial [Salaquimonas sp.]